MIILERCFRRELIDELEAGRGAERHPHRNCAIQLHNR
jgi:hypothetical protein